MTRRHLSIVCVIALLVGVFPLMPIPAGAFPGDDATDLMLVKADVIVTLTAMLVGADPHDAKGIEKAIKEVTKSLDDKLWTSTSTLDPKHGKKVFDSEAKAVKELAKIVKGESPLALQAQAVIDTLVEVDRRLASEAIDAATAASGDQTDINKANDDMAKAQDELDKGHPDSAIKHYKDAWDNAQKALVVDGPDNAALVVIERELAQGAIEDAWDAYYAVCSDPTTKECEKAAKELAKAAKEMAKADEELAKGHSAKAIGKYKKAREKADKALKGLALVEPTTGNVLIVKETNPAGGTGFGFTHDIAAPNSFALDDGSTQTFLGVPPGVYSVTETVPAGWDLTSVTCDNGSPAAAIDLGAGDTVTCVFTNTEHGAIVVEKQTVPDGDPQAFTFTGAAAGSIRDDEQIVVPNLVPGTYTVSETVPAGWGLTDLNCDDGGSATPSTTSLGTATATFEVDAGETVTCVFTNTVDPVATIVSDDFDRANLDTAVWSFVDPVGDSSVAMTGTGTSDAYVEITVPAGPSHDAWVPNNSARIMQPIDDADFEVEAKWDSVPSAGSQMQGIIIEGDADNWLRFGVYSDGSSLRSFMASISGGSATQRGSAVVTPGTSVWLKVNRTGDNWTMSYSDDGATWSPAGTFPHPLAVTAAGAYSGNHPDGTAPAFTSQLDYFFDAANPIVSEDDGAPPDTWDPFIHTVSHSVTGLNEVTFTFFTDEPATGRVDFGETTTYGGFVTDGGGLYEHSIVVMLSGSAPGTTYHYMVSAEDLLGRTSSTGDYQFTYNEPAGPDIAVWYGDTQSFGALGKAQPFANVLGNATDPDGVASMSYTLDGGAPVALTVGPDFRRLEESGDFNIDLAFDDLAAGSHTLVITAVDGIGATSTHTVTVTDSSNGIWPAQSIDWSTLAADAEIHDVAQVIDGLWTVTPEGLRTVVPGYDRLVGVGDVRWDDYEIEVPITVHGPVGGVGLMLRWPGHSANGGTTCAQPLCGYLPLGEIGWYRGSTIELWKNGPSKPMSLTRDVPYVFKMRVENNPTGALYSLKVWEESTAEPVLWDLIAQEPDRGPLNPQNGSPVLIAHNTDATFGIVTITPLTTFNIAPNADDDSGTVDAVGGSTVIDVLFNDEDDDGYLVPGTVTEVSSPAYGSVSIDPLTGEITYDHVDLATFSDSFTYTVEDDDGVASGEATVTIGIGTPPPDPFASDDFDSATLDPRWTFVDPVGDSSVAMTGTGTSDAYAEITVPAGPSHNAWAPNNSARIMQAANDVDFEVEAKWDSVPTARYQMQGIIIEEDANNWLRFGVYHDGSSLNAFMASISGGSAGSEGSAVVTPGTSVWMKVNRTGDNWTMSYSDDGATWSLVGTFPHPLAVTAAGAYSGNHPGGGTAPAFTSQLDYFFDAANPIVPEDGP